MGHFVTLSRSWTLLYSGAFDSPVAFTLQIQLCQNVQVAGNFAAFSQFLAAYSTLDFTRNPLACKGTWHLLPTTPSSMLPTATKHYDRAADSWFVLAMNL